MSFLISIAPAGATFQGAAMVELEHRWNLNMKRTHDCREQEDHSLPYTHLFLTFLIKIYKRRKRDRKVVV